MLAVAAALALVSQSAAFPPSQRELNGFLLGQYNYTVRNRFGKPFQVIDHGDGWKDHIHALSVPKNAYMAFGYPATAAANVYAIQISSRAPIPMLPFCGLKLGDSRERVVGLIGEPSETKPLEDIGGELLSYEGRNYTFEINPEGRLSSIRIVGYVGFEPEPQGLPTLAPFAEALRSKDVGATLGFLMPDFEVYRGRRTIMFKRGARQDLSDRGSPIHQVVFGATRSVRSSLLADAGMGQMQARVRDDGAAYPVFKFEKSKRIRELVFRWHAGKWRVWEVALNP